MNGGGQHVLRGCGDWGPFVGQRLLPSGHAVNAVPVTENERIPDIDEVIEAQLFARRLIERGEGLPPLIDVAAADRVADRLLEGDRKSVV